MTIFDKIINREVPANIVYENENLIAFHDVHPQAPVHVLIVPKKWVPHIGEAHPSHSDLLGQLLLASGTIAKQLGVIESGFRLVINHGTDAGETVPHLHVHLLGGRPMAWPPG